MHMPDQAATLALEMTMHLRSAKKDKITHDDKLMTEWSTNGKPLKALCTILKVSLKGKQS